MIALKEHNDIVQKLMKELATREAELKVITKQKTKAPQQAPQLQPTVAEKQLSAKITQLNKEYKDKISTLTQQLRSKSTENKELKERLTTKANMEARQKEHIAEVLKKNYDRKPSSPNDYKVSALISHYEAEINKKIKFIETLQKQLREAQTKRETICKEEEEDDQNLKDALVNEEKTKGVALVEHQRQVGRVKIEAAKYRKLFEEKEKEYRDLSRRYTDLTNQYYKIVNSYGIQLKQVNTNTIKSTMNSKSTQQLQSKLKANALQNLLQEMAASDTEADSSSLLDKADMPREINVNPTRMMTNDEVEKEQARQSFGLSKLEEILSLLGLQDPAQLVPTLSRFKVQIQEYELADTICRSLQAFLYNIGKGKIARNELVKALDDFQCVYSRNMEAVDLLDQVCIEAGAKRDKLLVRLQQLLATREEYYQQLKNLKYTQQLGKANKVVQFIEFFELDRDEAALPQQLVTLQEQLKTISKYVKQVRVILGIENDKSSQMVLELALRYMQKSTSLMAQIEKKNKSKPV